MSATPAQAIQVLVWLLSVVALFIGYRIGRSAGRLSMLDDLNAAIQKTLLEYPPKYQQTIGDGFRDMLRNLKKVVR